MARRDKRSRNVQSDVRVGFFEGKTVQETIPLVEWYENNIFRLDENTYSVVCTFTNAGYLSKTDQEQKRKYRAYQKALASLPTYIHYEEIVANRPVNKQTYIDAVGTNPNPGADEYADAFFGIQKKFIDKIDREISLKRHLLALSTTVENGESPYNKLFDAVAMLVTRFREMGSELTVLTPEEVLAELYSWYNPFGGTMPKLPLDFYGRGLIVRDIIAPEGIEYKKDSLVLGFAHCRIFTILSYGREIVDDIVYTLLNNDLPVAVIKHIEHVEKDAALRNVRRQRDELESRRQNRLSKNKNNGTNYIPIEMERSIQGCNEILDKLAGDEEFMRQTVYVAVYARSAEQLDEYSDRIRSAALSVHCTLKATLFLMEKAFASILPLGKNYVERELNLLSSEAAVMTPFSYECFLEPNGFWYGQNERSGEPIIMNRKLGKSAHGFVLGTTGSGKGFWSKNEIANILFQPFTANDEVIAIDATGEFIPLSNAVHGRVIELEPSSETHLNPLYISPAQLRNLGRQKAIASKIDHLIALLSQIKAGDGLNATEKSLVDAVASRCLRKGNEKNPATLNMFYDELEEEAKNQPGLKKLVNEMRGWIKRYVEGSISLFSGEDNEEEGEGDRLIVYSVRNLTGDLRDAAMLAMLERIESRVMENYAAGRWTWVYLEEAHRYFDAEKNKYAAGRFARLWAEMRHYGAIMTAITQLPKPVLESKDGSTMLALSRFVVMAELDGTNISAVTEQYELNEDQRRTLASADIGQYIVSTNGAPTPVTMIYPGKLPQDKNLMYDLFNTSFEESPPMKEGS